jgi:dCTP diphosphatase
MSEEKKYEGFDKELTLEMLRKEVVQFADDRDWNQFHQPRNLLLAMVMQ